MDSIAIMAELKKGHNFAILGPIEEKKNNNNKGSLIFCTDAIYKILVPNSSGSLDIVGTLFSQKGE